MREKIGGVVLDYEHYCGEDRYSDGPIEDELLDIAKLRLDDYSKLISERNNWTILYHFSSIRQNIIEWLPICNTQSVLEIGAGCGAITGALAKKAGNVTCIDLSKKRSLINAHRHSLNKNIGIQVGNFQDIESDFDQDYDWITLIGVFEYSEGYIQGEQPYHEMLKRVRKHLKPGGKVVIAIENRLGLKYWAGCAEDHNGCYFEGIEGYRSTTGARTFSKPEIERIFDEAGGFKAEFYYPYPDYKFPLCIYSDFYLPKKGDLRNNMCNMDRQRLLLFDETKVYDSLVESGRFPEFSNSFLIILEED